MKVNTDRESFADQLSRLDQMTDARSQTWDLSDNDRLAIAAVLRSHDGLLLVLKDLLTRAERELADPEDVGEVQAARAVIERAK